VIVAAAIAAVGAVVAARAGVPRWVVSEVEARGGSVGSAGWCGRELCLWDLRFGPATIEVARMGADRVAWLSGARVVLSNALGTGGTSWLGVGAGPSADPLPIARVMAEDLVLDGLPLPPLSGELWPRRDLSGPGVTLRDDRLDAEVETDYGLVRVEASRGGAGLAIVARCSCRVPAGSVARVDLAGVETLVEGTFDGGKLRARATVHGVELLIDDAEIRREGEAMNVEARWSLPPTPMADVYRAVGDIVPETAHATVVGTVAGSGTVRWPGLEVECTPTVEGFAVDGLVDDTYAVGPFAYTGRDADGRPLRVISGEGSPGWLPLAEVGPMLPMAIVAAEDARFYEHPGYDLRTIEEAMGQNRARGEAWRGGSTLSQQLAKNLFTGDERTYARKLRELLYAVEMERELRKKRIMELYVNVVEWGPGIRGAAAAARAYFLKQPAGLLPEEAAFLASVLPSPRTAYREQFVEGRVDRARVDAIIDGMRALPEADRRAALQRELHLVKP
jgi:hypothetical protein